MILYILDDAGQPMPTDLMTYSRWMRDNERNVGDDTIGEVRVSTVFLAIDHSAGDGPPVLWETMTFGPEPWSGRQWRYTNYHAAWHGHAAIVEALRSGDGPPEIPTARVTTDHVHAREGGAR